MSVCPSIRWKEKAEINKKERWVPYVRLGALAFTCLCHLFFFIDGHLQCLPDPPCGYSGQRECASRVRVFYQSTRACGSWESTTAPCQVLDDVVWPRTRVQDRLARVRRADGDDLAARRAPGEDARWRVFNDQTCANGTSCQRVMGPAWAGALRAVGRLDAQPPRASEVRRGVRLSVRDVVRGDEPERGQREPTPLQGVRGVHVRRCNARQWR